MADVSIATPHHALNAYLATPAGAGPWPGVVIIHDVFGMGADLRGQAEGMAEAGFLAIAPDLFSWGNRFACLRATFADMQAGSGPAFDDIDAVRGWLQQRPDCTGRIGIMGFCMGGGFALFGAVGHDFGVSSVNYGQLPKDLEATLRGACPIVGSFGAKDGMLKGAAAKLEGALDALGVPHDVKEYPDVGHAFMNAHKGPAGLLAKTMGAGYHAASAEDARRRIVAFFGEHLAAN